MSIAIIGAGIGGLVTALSLHRAGFGDIRIYERVRQLRPLGVGINLLPHAVRELTELGLRDDVEAIATAPRRLSYVNRHGQPIWSEARGTAAGYRWPQLSVHRGELQLALVEAVRERLGPDTILLGHRLTGLDATDDGAPCARALFETSGGEVAVDADLVIGADGIHSAVRALRYPDEGAPRWNGLTLWRGTAVVPEFLDGATMIMAGDDQLKFVAYPLRREPDGSVAVNFIAEQRSDGSRAETADWNRPVPIAPIAELFSAWRFDWLDIPAVIANAQELLEYPMVDRDPLPRWTFGRSTLLGDAAHSMYPNGSNGASQAILDARTLAYSLATAGDLVEGLRRYEDTRRPATADLLALTRQQGPERVMVLAHERAPDGFADITDVIPAAELREIADGYKRTAGFHPEALNTRASLDARVGAGAGAPAATSGEALP
ncbi:flavin-dependent oxidoreductase [Leifsonia sp. McL0607]|uniref:flavin-dependent oxidoreductase n=1 Tax=Leifsonia sp. McL0607 TaxID=3415672 RepID=UPI003CF4D9C2